MRYLFIFIAVLLLWPEIRPIAEEPQLTKVSIQEAKELVQTIEMINKLPDIKANDKLIEFYAHLINKHCKKETRPVLIAILYVESKFDHMANNRNEDWGIAQINFRTWSKFFNIKKALDLYDPDINIKTAMSILTLAKNVHGKKKDWYSYYHSWNHLPRNKYAKKVNNVLKILGVNNDRRN